MEEFILNKLIDLGVIKEKLRKSHDTAAFSPWQSDLEFKETYFEKQNTIQRIEIMQNAIEECLLLLDGDINR